MKKYLIPNEGNFYKANLHCHTVISDGKFTPEQVKKAYMDHGYSIVAYTDHDVMLPHFDLEDENFLPLTGYELELNGEGKKTCHICFIALDRENTVQGCYHRTKYLWGNCIKHKDEINFDDSLPDFEREYTVECVNKMIKEMREKGFFVTYNHPTWSVESYPKYANYHGMNAMEICNYGCVVEGYEEYNPRVYDDMLNAGDRIYCIGTDDNHNWYPLDSRRSDSFGAFTVIKADKLEYKTVTNALLAGNFYASQGPIINALWMEDNKICIECEPCDKILFNTGAPRHAEVKYAENEPLTYAEFEVKPEYKFVRLTVIDKFGSHANTNAYFTDEIL